LNPAAIAYASGDKYIIKEYDSYTKYEQYAQFTYNDTISSQEVKFIITDPVQALGIYQNTDDRTVNLGILTVNTYYAPKSKFILTLDESNKNKNKDKITSISAKINKINLQDEIE